MRTSLLTEAKQYAAKTGLNLFGMVDAERFDAWQPCERRTTRLLGNCGTVIVLGSGGRASVPHLTARPVTPAGVAGPPLAALTRDAAQGLAGMLQSQSVRNRVVEAGVLPRLNFARLAEAAGFGTVSPVSGLLLHPEFGPWVTVCAALLLEGRPFGPVADASITDLFQPCCSCARPCVAACPAGVHDGLGHQDLARCAEHRHQGGCASGCGTRQACPVGADYREGANAAVHWPSHPVLSPQRSFGLAVWRLVPRFLRGLR